MYESLVPLCSPLANRCPKRLPLEFRDAPAAHGITAPEGLGVLGSPPGGGQGDTRYCQSGSVHFSFTMRVAWANAKENAAPRPQQRSAVSGASAASSFWAMASKYS